MFTVLPNRFTKVHELVVDNLIAIGQPREIIKSHIFGTITYTMAATASQHTQQQLWCFTCSGQARLQTTCHSMESSLPTNGDMHYQTFLRR